MNGRSAWARNSGRMGSRASVIRPTKVPDTFLVFPRFFSMCRTFCFIVGPDAPDSSLKPSAFVTSSSGAR